MALAISFRFLMSGRTVKGVNTGSSATPCAASDMEGASAATGGSSVSSSRAMGEGARQATATRINPTPARIAPLVRGFLGKGMVIIRILRSRVRTGSESMAAAIRTSGRRRPTSRRSSRYARVARGFFRRTRRSQSPSTANRRRCHIHQRGRLQGRKTGASPAVRRRRRSPASRCSAS